MRIYIASRFRDRERLRPIRELIWKVGHVVVSTWLDEIIKPDWLTTAQWFKKLAIKDLTEIKMSDVLVLDTLGQLVPGAGGGRETEWGFALAQFQDKLVILVGPENQAFHYLADLHFKNWKEFFKWLKELK